MRLHLGNSLEYLQADSGVGEFDVAFVDPMFPLDSTKRGSAPKKGVAAARVLLGDVTGADDASFIADIIAAAQGVPRVVVKRPKRAGVTLVKPSYSLSSRNMRYDVYLELGGKRVPGV